MVAFLGGFAFRFQHSFMGGGDTARLKTGWTRLKKMARNDMKTTQYCKTLILMRPYQIGTTILIIFEGRSRQLTDDQQLW